MKMPHVDSAHVPHSKLSEYLLSQEHAIGKSKAKFFQRYGYNKQNIEDLERKLVLIAKNNDIVEEISSTFGTKYIIDGEIETLDHRKIAIRTVWIIDYSVNSPRFVTAYPA